MRALAKSARIGTTISLSLTVALAHMIPPVIAVVIWIMTLDSYWMARQAACFTGRMRHSCLGKRKIARFGDDWERNLLLARVAFPAEGA